MITLTLPLRLIGTANHSQNIDPRQHRAKRTEEDPPRRPHPLRIAFLVARVHWLDVTPFPVPLQHASHRGCAQRIDIDTGERSAAKGRDGLPTPSKFAGRRC